MKTDVLPGFPLKSSLPVILYLIPNCLQMVKNGINHICHLMKTLKELFLVTRHSLLQWQVAFYLRRRLRRLPGRQDIGPFLVSIKPTPYWTSCLCWLIMILKKKKADFAEENCSKTRSSRDRGCFLCKSPQLLFSRERGAMWPHSHLITPVGASNSHIPVAVLTRPPSLFCLVIPQDRLGMGEHFSSTQ